MKPADKARGEAAQKPPGAAKTGRRGKTERCPICKKPTVHTFRPFCSKHCADIDLARWLGGDYVIPGEPGSGIDEEPEN